MILVEVSDATGDNDYVKSNPGAFMYPLTTCIDFRRIKPSASSLLLNTHLPGTAFLPLVFTTLHFVQIQAFLDRKPFTSDNADIFHKCTFGFVIVSLRVSGSPAPVEIDVMHVH